MFGKIIFGGLVAALVNQTNFRLFSFFVFLLAGFTYADKISGVFDNLVVKDFKFIDKSRNRLIPALFYVGEESKGKVTTETAKLPVVIINHGYSVKNTEYSFIANILAGHGYFVVSIQHDLNSDPDLPKTDNLFERRRPVWERGVCNILFVISELKRMEHNLDLSKVILIGHSNGGDISMMFTDIHPELVKKVISLDSLRYPFPIKNHIPILSLRANDTRADNGVLPKSGVTLVKLENAKHIDLCDRGPEVVKQKVVELVLKFMEEK